ncbi:RNA polymerase sigma factor [Actinomadura rupiterrae]|uniref:RNA polymerase sigma factor n=1 Tax=Actinomadura rupiterrae TaxID=559627 RepID=UPI0020A24279|nr:RNA polymerase sigma factor [Actinomadura rupiterrae]MCP2338697.1 RNA polymerase sigma-70 factor (ECF subfamily) [Actinomadura rupiterrae]
MHLTHPPPAASAGATASGGSAASGGADREADVAGEAESDASVIERSRDEPELFSLIFDRYHARIHRYAAARLGAAAAEDVTADTFLAAFDQRHRFDPAHSEARPWLYGIAANLISRHRRAETRFYRAMERTARRDDEPGHADQVIDRTAAGQLHPTLARGLARLSKDDRAALTLIAFAGLSYAEAAVALGVPPGTVGSRVNRARRKLRAALKAVTDE